MTVNRTHESADSYEYNLIEAHSLSPSDFVYPEFPTEQEAYVALKALGARAGDSGVYRTPKGEHLRAFSVNGGGIVVMLPYERPFFYGENLLDNEVPEGARWTEVDDQGYQLHRHKNSDGDIVEDMSEGYDGLSTAITSQLSSIRDSTMQPAGSANNSRKVWQEVNGVLYEAWAKNSASGTDLQVTLDDPVNAPDVWELQGTGVPRPFNAAIAHLYAEFTVVYVETAGSSRRYFDLLPGASTVQKQTNPTDTTADTSKWRLYRTVVA